MGSKAKAGRSLLGPSPVMGGGLFERSIRNALLALNGPDNFYIKAPVPRAEVSMLGNLLRPKRL